MFSMNDKKKVILITEDEDAMRLALTDMISYEGYHVIEAKDGEEGLAVAFREHPDLILLDILMPRMDGLEMLKKLRADEWGAKVPIFVLTNLGGNDEIAKMVENNVFEYFVKSDVKIREVIDKMNAKLKV